MKKWGVDNELTIFKTNKQNKHRLWIFAWGVAIDSSIKGLTSDQNRGSKWGAKRRIFECYVMTSFLVKIRGSLPMTIIFQKQIPEI